jgi:hypothetical protein
VRIYHLCGERNASHRKPDWGRHATEAMYIACVLGVALFHHLVKLCEINTKRGGSSVRVRICDTHARNGEPRCHELRALALFLGRQKLNGIGMNSGGWNDRYYSSSDKGTLARAGGGCLSLRQPERRLDAEAYCVVLSRASKGLGRTLERARQRQPGSSLVEVAHVWSRAPV